MSLFKYALPVWGSASYSTYLVNRYKLQKGQLNLDIWNMQHLSMIFLKARITQFGIISKIILGNLLHIYYLHNEQES